MNDSLPESSPSDNVILCQDFRKISDDNFSVVSRLKFEQIILRSQMVDGISSRQQKFDNGFDGQWTVILNTFLVSRVEHLIGILSNRS